MHDLVEAHERIGSPRALRGDRGAAARRRRSAPARDVHPRRRGARARGRLRGRRRRIPRREPHGRARGRAQRSTSGRTRRRGSASSRTWRPRPTSSSTRCTATASRCTRCGRPTVSRLYVQVDPDASIDDWSDRRIWDTLQERLGVDGWTLEEGEITEKSISPMRSFVASTLSYGRLFLVGDAGHIVPPTGAKGLNSAIADVAMLGRALADHTAGDSQRARDLQRAGARAAVEDPVLLAVDDRHAAHRRPPHPGGRRGLPLPQPGRPAAVRDRIAARDVGPRRAVHRPADRLRRERADGRADAS